MNTKLYCSKLMPGTALKVSERTEAGELVGSWRGFWFPQRGVIRLYPDRNPFCTWRVSHAPKTVSDVFIYTDKEV